MSAALQRRSTFCRTEAAVLLRAARDGDPAARARLIEAYLPLARALARRYANCGERMEDLEQVASLGLIKAVDRFEPARGVGLATFAVPTIVGEIKRHLRDRSALIRVPRRELEAHARVSRARQRLAYRLQRSPTRVELAGADELERDDVTSASRVDEARAPITLADIDPAVTADEVFRATEDRAALARGMRALHRRERQALRCRYFGDMSQSEIAAALGISQTHASRLLASGLAKLRANLDPDGVLVLPSELHSAHGDPGRRQATAA